MDSKINASSQKKCPLKNSHKRMTESRHLRRKTEKIESKDGLLSLKTYITKPKCTPLSILKGKASGSTDLGGHATRHHKTETTLKKPADKNIVCEILDLNDEIEPILETEELEVESVQLPYRKPPIFTTSRPQGNGRGAGEEEKAEQVCGKQSAPALLGRVPVFKRNVSPKGEDDDLTGWEIELTGELNKKYDEKMLGVSTVDNSSRCSSDLCIESSPHSEKEQIGPQSFMAHKLLGKGSFGEVYLVEKLGSSSFYAMKVIKKEKIMNENLVKYVITERRVMSEISHPFIVKLHFAFQSNSRLFLVMDYCPGGDLTDYLRREKKFKEDRARVYMAEVLLALEHLHRKNIIFRDLKPDNVVLDSEGHALLTDFGLSKEGVHDNQGAKSFCGSLSYLAPEMIKRTGHGKSVDWYLLGVLLYEMLVGVPPYYSANKYCFVLP
eukprot:TRINITY_DN1514_c0_g1_i4.p1 TRINITY_DN1514_c0_g1~~TRINITY_DN1514_c0_g1_i4.p1  ORF type:complete len:439 (-),score=122.67 TRINITY_DN1514_c0_g1_i4:292-1608(-)